MIEEITSLFVQTYSGQGDDINAQIQNAAQSLDNYGGSPEFCECIFQIIQSDQISQDIQRAAIIYLTNMISSHWDEEISPESKMIIINSLPTTLLNISETSYPLLNRLSASIVRLTFFNGEWDEINQVIISGFESKEDNQILASLILLNSISILFSQSIPNENYDLYSELTTHFLEPLTEMVSTSQSLFQVSLCFKVASHFSKKIIPPLFEQNPEILQVWLSRAMQITEPIENSTYYMFVRSSIKFLLLYFYRYNKSLLPEELPMEMVNCIVGCIKNSPGPQILCKCAYFLKLAIKDEYTSPGILSDFMEFTKAVILPFFVLTTDDTNSAINDPFTFIQNFHSDCIDDSDSRSILSRAVEMQAKRSPEIIETFGSLLYSILPLREPEYDEITYSVCYLFSTVSKHIHPNEVPSLCEQMVPLLQSDSFLVRSGALLALRDMKNIPAQIALSTFSLLIQEDEALLVKYYAARSLSSFLEYIDEQNTQAIREGLDEKIIFEVIKSYFFLCQEFNDYDFIGLIKTLINFFGPCLHQISSGFVSDMYHTFVEISKLEYQSNLLLQSISVYINLLAEYSQNDELNSTIEMLIGEVAESLKNGLLVPKAVISVADLISIMIAISPIITENHWKIMGLLVEITQYTSENINQDDSNSNTSSLKSLVQNSESSVTTNYSFTGITHSLLLESVCTGYKNLVIKDIETARKAEVATELINTAISLICCQPDLKEAGPAFYLMGSLLVILAECEIGDMSELYEKLAPIAVEGFSIPRVMSSSVFLFAAMIIFNSDTLFNILQAQTHDVLSAWVNSIEDTCATVLLAVINKKYQAFGQDDFVMLLSRAVYVLNQIRNHEKMFDDEELPDSLDYSNTDAQKLTVFCDNEIFAEFNNMLESLKESNQEIYQQVQEYFGDPINEIVENAAAQICS